MGTGHVVAGVRLLGGAHADTFAVAAAGRWRTGRSWVGIAAWCSYLVCALLGGHMVSLAHGLKQAHTAGHRHV